MVGQTTPARCSADEAQLERVIDNLVSNAIHHTPAGTSIDVRVTMTGSWIVVTVDDDGPGVDDGDKQRIFEPYNRGSAGSDRPGTGLGLFLAREFTELHGGFVHCADAAGGGARFVVRLPQQAT